MNSEFYPGWLTHWQERMQRVDTQKILATMKEMLDQRANFNFYMFFGGTNFGFMNGTLYTVTYNKSYPLSPHELIKCIVQVGIGVREMKPCLIIIYFKVILYYQRRLPCECHRKVALMVATLQQLSVVTF